MKSHHVSWYMGSAWFAGSLLGELGYGWIAGMIAAVFLVVGFLERGRPA